MIEQSVQQLADQSDRLAVTLWAEADGSFYVRGVEIMDGESRLRLSFQRQNGLKEVLSFDAYQEIEEIATRALLHRGLLCLPDFRLSLRNLVLAGCRVLITAAEDGAEQIMLRFRHCFGNVLGLFRRNVLALNMAVDEVTVETKRALDELYLQMVNFGYHVDALIQNGQERCPDQLRDELSSLSHRIRETVFALNQRDFGLQPAIAGRIQPSG